MARLPIGRLFPHDHIDRDDAGAVRQYVEERFHEVGWCDLTPPHTAKDIKVDTFPDAYHVIVPVPVRRQDIPDAMLQLAIEVEEELASRGYPTLVILRPTVVPAAVRALGL